MITIVAFANQKGGVAKTTSTSTPVKLALRALYASVTRLGQIEGELKIDEIAALRGAKKKIERAIVTALDQK